MLLKNSDKSVNFRYVFFAFGVAVNCQWVALPEGWRCGWAYFGTAWCVCVWGFL